MYHVAIISENRIFLKQIYEMIEDNSIFRIYVIPFSMDAYEIFYQNHVDIVILDTSVFLPYENILEQFKQCQWYYHILLLHSGPLSYIKQPNLFYLDRDKLSKELFSEVLTHILNHKEVVRQENIGISLEWSSVHSFTINPDAYHLILINCLDTSHKLNSKILNEIIKEASDYCQLKEIFHTNNEILFYVKRSHIKKEFNISLLSQVIFRVIPFPTALLYQENVNWKMVENTCLSMKAHEIYCYFLSDKLCLLSDIKQPQADIPVKHLKEQCSLLIHALLYNDVPSTRHILQDLYLHIIKPSLQFSYREYIRVQLLFLNFLIAKEKITFEYISVEAELEGILGNSMFKQNNYPTNRIQEIIITATLAIYNKFHTNISLEGIADQLNLNKIYLSRIFKEHFNLTILDALQILRILHAKYYLIYSDKKVADIANEIGFTDAGYFSKFFRKATGYTALEFRMKREDEKEMKNPYAGIMAI